MLNNGRIGLRESFPVPALLADGQWVDAAIQIQPDGRVGVFINREPTFTSRFSFRPEAAERHRITLAGAAADTKVHFRDVYLWLGARY